MLLWGTYTFFEDRTDLRFDLDDLFQMIGFAVLKAVVGVLVDIPMLVWSFISINIVFWVFMVEVLFMD